MPTLKISIFAELDGALVAGFPLVRRVSVDESLGMQKFERATGGGAVALPLGELATTQVLLIAVDKAATVGVTVDLAADGLVCIVGGNITGGATLNNASGSTAIVQQLAGGT